MPPLKEDGLPDYSRGFPVLPQTRNWDLDHGRLMKSNEQQSKDPRAFAHGAPTSSERQPDQDPGNWRPPAAGGGARARTIVETAQRLMQTHPSSTDYYFQAEVACASFVSTVLETAKIIPPSPLLSSNSVADPRRYCPTLPPFLTGQGAIRVTQGTLPLTEENVIRTLIPGDIIFYYRDSRGRFGHVEIYVGDGKTIGNSSSRRQVTHHKAVNLRGTYQSFTAWRFT
jgi:hypothetical protein